MSTIDVAALGQRQRQFRMSAPDRGVTALEPPLTPPFAAFKVPD